MPKNKPEQLPPKLTYSQFIVNLCEELEKLNFKVDFSGGKLIMDIISDRLAAIPDTHVDEFVKNMIWKSRQRNPGK